MSKERSFGERAAEFSKKIDKYGIIAGGAIIFFSVGVGAAMIIGSTMTYISADKIQKGMEKRRSKKSFK